MKVFPNLNATTHMPFILRVGDRNILLLSVRTGTAISTFRGNKLEYEVWKLHYTDWDDEADPLHPLATGFPGDAVECNPMGYEQDGKIFITFIAGVKDERGTFADYHLYEMSGATLDTLGRAQRLDDGDPWHFLPPIFSGFRNGAMLVASERTTSSLGGERDFTKIWVLPNGTDDLFELQVTIPWLYRVSYFPNEPHRLLITGEFGNTLTLVYDFNRGVVEGELLVEGHPVYKSFIHDLEVVHALRTGVKFDDRELQWATEWELRETSIKVTRLDIPRLKPLDGSVVEMPGVTTMARNLAASTWDVAKGLLQGGPTMATPELKASRLAICGQCEFLDQKSMRCGKCGCYVKAKAGINRASCPILKW